MWRDLVGRHADDSLRFAQVARAHDAFMLGDWDGGLRTGRRRGTAQALVVITAWAQPRRMNALLSTVNETRARAAVGRGDFEEAFALSEQQVYSRRRRSHSPYSRRVRA